MAPKKGGGDFFLQRLVSPASERARRRPPWIHRWGARRARLFRFWFWFFVGKKTPGASARPAGTE
eukprot:757912-Pyramimonas_sp.AAC.1